MGKPHHDTLISILLRVARRWRATLRIGRTAVDDFLALLENAKVALMEAVWRDAYERDHAGR